MISILRTKLFIPPVPATIVSRPQLVERLEQGLASKLTLISAPAGYGKTTLLSSWARHSERSFAWLALDEHDNDPARFLAYLSASLQTGAPDTGKDIPIFQGYVEVMTALLNDVASHPGAIVLVLDDYHAIVAEDVHLAVAYFLDHLPGNLHVVIATRQDPPLPAPRWRGRGQLREIRQKDLEFTLSETQSLFKSILPPELLTDGTELLLARTEGWVAGLQMAALASTGRDDVAAFMRSFGGAHRHILDYLIEEVLKRQPATVQSFLLRTAILDRFNASLCDALLQTRDSRRMLDDLTSSNSFIVSLDDKGRWYRYHQLFAELLRMRLRLNEPGLIPGLHLAASRWFEQHDLVQQAIAHALAAEDIERVARLVADNVLRLVYHGELCTLNAQLEALSKDIISPNPWLNVAQAWAWVSSGNLDAATQALEQAPAMDNIRDPAKHRLFAGHIAVVYAYVSRLQGDLPRLGTCVQVALEQLPDENSVMRGMVLTLLASFYRWTGELDLAAQTCAHAVEILKTCGDNDAVLDPWGDLVSIFISQGKLYAAFQTCQKAIAFARQNSEISGRVSPASGYLHTCMCRVLREWNELKAAREHAQIGVQICKRWGQVDFLISAYVEQAHTLQACGQACAAMGALSQAK